MGLLPGATGRIELMSRHSKAIALGMATAVCLCTPLSAGDRAMTQSPAARANLSMSRSGAA